MSAPYFLMISSGATVFPRLFDIALPCPSRTNPWVSTAAVRRLAADRDRGEERGVEPAAVLVGPLEVEVHRHAEAPLLGDRRPGHARVPPHVEDVLLAAELGLAALRARRALREVGGRVAVPGLDRPPARTRRAPAPSPAGDTSGSAQPSQ